MSFRAMPLPRAPYSPRLPASQPASPTLALSLFCEPPFQTLVFACLEHCYRRAGCEQVLSLYIPLIHSSHPAPAPAPAARQSLRRAVCTAAACTCPNPAVLQQPSWRHSYVSPPLRLRLVGVTVSLLGAPRCTLPPRVRQSSCTPNRANVRVQANPPSTIV